MYGGKVLRVKKLAVQCHVGFQLRILFGGDNLAIHHKDYFRRHPSAAQLLIFIELCLLSLRAITAAWSEHSYKVKVLLIDPELRRVQIALPGADDVDRAALPGVLAKD